MSDKQTVDGLRDELEASRRSDPVAIIADQASAIAGQTRQALAVTRERVDSQADIVADRIRENPFMAVAIAAGVGYLLRRVTS